MSASGQAIAFSSRLSSFKVTRLNLYLNCPLSSHPARLLLISGAFWKPVGSGSRKPGRELEQVPAFRRAVKGTERGALEPPWRRQRSGIL